MDEATLPSPGYNRETVTGASVTPVYTKRSITMYALTETEVTTISSINTRSTTDFSIGTFLLGLGVSVYTNAIFYSQLNSAGEVAKGYVAPLVCIVGAYFLISGAAGNRKRSRLWAKLKSESKINDTLQL